MQILLITPDLTCTGAALSLLEMAKFFIKKGHQVSVVGRNGDLSTEFSNVGVNVLPLDLLQIFNKNYDLYIANTLLAIEFALDHAPHDKIIAWIHETSDRFPKESRIAERLRYLKYSIFPAEFQIDSYIELLPFCKLFKLNNCVSMECATVNSTSLSLAVTGYWEKLKNQDFLVQTNSNLDLGITFNFIGSYKPIHLKNSNHNFWGRVPFITSKNLIANSYGYTSASLTEVQPLSVIEAVMSGIPVLVSDIPAHRELKSYIPNIILFDANDASSFQKGYFEMLDQKNDSGLFQRSKVIASEIFGSDAFQENCNEIFSEFIN